VGSTVNYGGFDNTVTLDGIRRLSELALTLLPRLAHQPFSRVWAGLRPHSRDGLPLIGPVADLDGVYIATGHFRNGILLGPLTGRLLAEMVLAERPSFSLEAFAPQRLGL